MTLPVTGHISNALRTNAEQKDNFEAQRDVISRLDGTAARVELTIAAGTAAIPARDFGGWFNLDTEGGAPTDVLDYLDQTNTDDGQIVTLQGENTGRVVTINHAAGSIGQLLMVDGADFALDTLEKWIRFQRRTTDWVEIARSYGADWPGLHDHFRIAAVPAHNTLCPHTRLRIDYTTAATVSVVADAVVLADSLGRLKRFNSLSETLNIGNTGANGRDVTENGGAEQASVWYHVWAIGKSDGTLDVFASQACYPGGSSIYSVLPSGYTWAGYIGAVYNDSGSNLIAFQQRGDMVTRTQLTAVSNGAATSMTSVSLAAAIPQTAREVRILLSVLNSTGSFTAVNGNLAANSGGGYGSISYYAPYVSNGNGAGSSVDLIILTAQTIWYSVSTGGRLTAVVTGWKF